MSFTDQQRFVASKDDVQRRWGLDGNGFRCHLCGHRFVAGDGVRWVYAGAGGATVVTDDGKEYGVTNFLTCDACDGDDVMSRWVALNQEFLSAKFWSLR